MIEHSTDKQALVELEQYLANNEAFDECWLWSNGTDLGIKAPQTRGLLQVERFEVEPQYP